MGRPEVFFAAAGPGGDRTWGLTPQGGVLLTLVNTATIKPAAAGLLLVRCQRLWLLLVLLLLRLCLGLCLCLGL